MRFVMCYMVRLVEERSDTSMLRSQFADDNVYTSVELTFQLKGKRYEIKRQLGHKTRE